MTSVHHLEASTMTHVHTCQSASHLACTHPVIGMLIPALLIILAVGPFVAMVVIEARKAKATASAPPSIPVGR